MMRIPKPLTGASTALLLLLPSCLDSTATERVEPTLEWTIASADVTVGEELTFHYVIEGNLLDRLRVDFGDGETFVRPLSGARRAEGQVLHTYAAAGVYTVMAEVVDGLAGPVQADVEVTVTAAPAAAAAGPGAVHVP